MPGRAAATITLAAVAAVATMPACEPQEPAAAIVAASPEEGAEVTTGWRRVAGATVVSIARDDPDLTRAITEARASVEEARRQWQAMPDQRGRWAVKWAAATSDGTIESLWVRPTHWSRFRIEGLLASAPRGVLVRAARLGDPVSFPIEELVDWVHLVDGTPEGPRRGGFTMTLLEQRYGRPGAPPDG